MSSDVQGVIRAKVVRGVLLTLIGIGAAMAVIGAYLVGVVAVGYLAHQEWGWSGAFAAVFGMLCVTALALWQSARVVSRGRRVASGTAGAAGENVGIETSPAETAQPPQDLFSTVGGFVTKSRGSGAPSVLPVAAVLLAVAAVFGPMRVFRFALRAWSLYKTAELVVAGRRESKEGSF